MWAYLFHQLVSLYLRHPHQLLTKGVNLSLRGGFFRVDCGFVVVGSLVEVDEVRGGPLSSEGAVPGIVPYLSTLKAGVVACPGCGLGDAASRVSSWPTPLVRGPGVAEVHRNRSVVERRGRRRGVHRGCPVSNTVSVSGGVWWSPSPHILLGTLEEWLGWRFSLLGCVSPVSCVRPPQIALVAEHALDDLAGPGGVDSLLFHFFVSGGEWGLHYFSGDRTGESS